MIRRILVPVGGDSVWRSVLEHAATIARRHGAHVIVVHCRTRPEELMPYSVPLPAFARETLRKQAAELADQQERALREELHGVAAGLGLKETDAPDGREASIELVDEFGSIGDIVKHNGRLADLIVVAKPDRDRNVGSNALKSAIFLTGRPVLMCARAGDADPNLGKRIAIGWNGSLEAARAVAATLDLAAAAEAVTILTAGKGELHGPPAEELAAYYRLRGVSAEIRRFEVRHPGAALLENTVAAGASLLVMGAYGQSHERETLFGGNTQYVVDKAEIPVVMAH
ncbi:MAG: universal stress protein [Pikeienuella sp.]|uniref:universal stress protein n=1 Tax=Pikeienuella sp. TaxID=2831957 RepID=UPI00391D76CF